MKYKVKNNGDSWIIVDENDVPYERFKPEVLSFDLKSLADKFCGRLNALGELSQQAQMLRMGYEEEHGGPEGPTQGRE